MDAHPPKLDYASPQQPEGNPSPKAAYAALLAMALGVFFAYLYVWWHVH